MTPTYRHITRVLVGALASSLATFALLAGGAQAQPLFSDAATGGYDAVTVPPTAVHVAKEFPLFSDAATGGYDRVNVPPIAVRVAREFPLFSDAATGGYTPVSTSPTVVRVVATSSGFDWGDAGIGAGAAVILIGLALAGIHTARVARSRHAANVA